MFTETIINVFNAVWPMLLIFCIVLISLRLVEIIKYKKKFIWYREIITLSFCIYIIFLFHIVTFQDVSWSTANFIPFKEIFRYVLGSEMFFKNVIGNMIMFMPYGFFVAFYLDLKKPYIVLLLTLIVSITIETTQLIIGRVFDVDDVFLNILGSYLGFILYILVKKAIIIIKGRFKK